MLKKGGNDSLLAPAGKDKPKIPSVVIPPMLTSLVTNVASANVWLVIANPAKVTFSTDKKPVAAVFPKYLIKNDFPFFTYVEDFEES